MARRGVTVVFPRPVEDQGLFYHLLTPDDRGTGLGLDLYGAFSLPPPARTGRNSPRHHSGLHPGTLGLQVLLGPTRTLGGRVETQEVCGVTEDTPVGTRDQ